MADKPASSHKCISTRTGYRSGGVGAPEVVSLLGSEPDKGCPLPELVQYDQRQRHCDGAADARSDLRERHQN